MFTFGLEYGLYGAHKIHFVNIEDLWWHHSLGTIGVAFELYYQIGGIDNFNSFFIAGGVMVRWLLDSSTYLVSTIHFVIEYRGKRPGSV
jgi:hypothetical protein